MSGLEEGDVYVPPGAARTTLTGADLNEMLEREPDDWSDSLKVKLHAVADKARRKEPE